MVFFKSKKPQAATAAAPELAPPKSKSVKMVEPKSTKIEEKQPQTILEESILNNTTTNLKDTTTEDSVDYTIVRGKSDRIYRVYKVIGKGGYGVVHKGAYEFANGNFLLIAIKSESTDSLDVEMRVLNRIKGGIHFCSLFDNGYDTFSKTRFMVMTLVGENLSSLRRQFGHLSLGTVLRVGIQTLHAIEQLHAKGFISRDVKPSNFAVGHQNALRRLVYMLDFGIARTYTDSMGIPLPRRQGTSFRGTSRYCALPQHIDGDQCRRDDVESWFYLLVELTSGRLPWSCFGRHEKDKIAESKQRARTDQREEFFTKCPTKYNLIMNVIDSWKFEATPDYDGLFVVLARLLDANGIKYDDRYDWENLDKYKSTPSLQLSIGEAPKSFEHCVFAKEAELHKIINDSPSPE